MAISGTEDISLVRKEVKESQAGSIQTTKTLIFKHEASAGDLVIDTTLLTPPAEALANGFIQDNPSSVNLLVNKKNLKIHSSRGVWLQMHEDFKVTGANTIQLIGNIASLGGALEGEVFTIYAAPIQANSILTTDHKKQYQEYLLPEGQTILNLGREYEVNRNPLAQIGSIRVFRNGVGPMLRNVGNAAASPLADGNYHEVDVGNGLGTTIEFNVAPSGQDDVIVVEFGLEYAGDFSLVGDMQSMWGSILKLAEDVKDLGPYDITRYINANPSEVERRGFGDILLKLLDLTYYSEQVAIIQDMYGPDVNAGTSPANAYFTRTLNVISGESSFVTLPVDGTAGVGGTNTRFTLQPGEYELTGLSLQYGSNNSNCRLRNVTDNTTLFDGSPAAAAVNTAQVPSFLVGKFTLTSPKTFELQHFTEQSVASFGKGAANQNNPDGNEWYAYLMFRKITKTTFRQALGL